jgi:endonuclease/exonuclease/phosphatase family metal-dependent hydrolase
VATYNLYLGADVTVIFGVNSPEEFAAKARFVLDQLRATDFPARAAAIAAILVRERVDVVGLQEVATWSRSASENPDGAERSEVWLDFLDELLAALERAGEAYDVHAHTSNFRGGGAIPGEASMTVLGHNVVLVRRASGVSVSGERTADFTRTLDVVTGMPGLTINIARSWGWIDAEVDGRPFRLVNSHIEAWDEKVRNAQRDELLAAVGEPCRPVVLVGDFNATPEAVGMPAAYVDAWAVAGGGGDGLTCGHRADLTGESGLSERIDYVWVRDAEVGRCWVVGARAEDRTPSGLWPSDHAGVVADILL